MKKSIHKNNSFLPILKVGPFNVFFQDLNSKYQKGFLERYSHFLSSDDKFDLVIKIEEKEADFLKDDTGYLKLEEDIDNGKKRLLSTSFIGYEPDNERISVLFSSPKNTETSYFTRLENHFRWVVANELMKNGGFLLHSSGIAKGESCSLFFGTSGDGKSTIVELGKGRGGKTLSDDLIIVYPQSNGYVGYGAPFYGVLPQKEKEIKPYPIKSVFRIRKSDQTFVKEISKGQALGLIVSHCQFVFSEKTRNEKLIPIVVKFLEKVSCFELYFKKDDSFWELI
ncbi:MAG: hypothetical protein N2445_00605 [Acidobacteria bacterium]|nr:hypothetical protein [Acidobacteriota bacterium]